MEIMKPLRYSLHVIVRPFDGFWDLKNEKRGSVSAASVILLMVVATQILKVQFTGHLFHRIQLQYYNIFFEIIGMVIPFLLWCISNWCLTTLMDGKGTFKDIYVASSYALTPFILINLPMIIMSNFITLEEGAFYLYFVSAAPLWCGFLMIIAMMMSHEYSFSKSVASSIMTIVGIGIMLFLFLIFVNLFSDSIAYFISLYNEILFRLY